MFKNKNLLIIGNYPTKNSEVVRATFIKAQVDKLKKYFNKIIIISPTPFFPKILTKLSFIPQTFIEEAKQYNYKYDNVEVYYPKFFTAPFSFFRKRNGNFAYKAALKCIKKNNLNFDLIHTHFTYPNGYVGVKLKDKFGKKVVLTTHGLHHTRINHMIKNEKAKYTWENTDLILNVSHQCIALLKNYGISRNKLHYIPNIVSLDKFKEVNYAKDKLNLSIPNKKIIVSVGNLVKKKGFEYLIDSLKLLKEKRNDFFCFIVGGGDLKDQLNKRIDKNRLKDCVKLVGPRPHNEIPLWMNIADLFVLNSFVENFGVVNIEALSCGTPVISTINGGSEEIITSSDYGFLIDNPTKITKLSEKIDNALDKDWDKDKMINYTKKFESSNIISKIIKEYRGLSK